MNLDVNNKEISDFHIMVGRNVKFFREKNQLTQMQLSQELGQSSTTIISQAELGKVKRFNLTQLYKMSKILNCDICEFFKENKLTY